MDDLRATDAAKPNHKGTRNDHRVKRGKLIGGGPRARTGRRLKLELRAARVALVPPEGRADEPDLGMLAVSAVEADPPAGAEPAAWLLLASAGEACA